MDKQVSAKDFILSLEKQYFHNLRSLLCEMRSSQLEGIDSAVYLAGIKSKEYAMALETFCGRMPNEEGEFLLLQLTTRMNIAHALREPSNKQEMRDIADNIYTAYSQLKKYFTEKPAGHLFFKLQRC